LVVVLVVKEWNDGKGRWNSDGVDTMFGDESKRGQKKGTK